MARSHADAFLEAILQDPDDDTPRLIFADWLEEQDDAASASRAEFIRVQCILADGHLPIQRRTELDRRQQQVLDKWGAEWARPIGRLVHDWKFHRGFINEVTMWDAMFLAHADRLFRYSPIQHLHLRPYWRPRAVFTGLSVSIPALADSRYLRNLRSLDLMDNRLESRSVRALLVSEHLTCLTTLDLSHNRIGDGGIRALATSPLLGRLERLDLRGNDIGTVGLRALAHALEELNRSVDGLRLQRLELSHDNLSTAGQRVIAESPLLRRLTRG